jgi:hypothetical protein
MLKQVQHDGTQELFYLSQNRCFSKRPMPVTEQERLRAIWNQSEIPVVIRKGKGHPLIVRLPFANDNRQWLQDGKRTSPTWIAYKKHWQLPRAWFNGLVERFLKRYSRLYIVQPYREQEKCAPACMNALGYECQCSCMGANHGAGMTSDWLVISGSFAVRTGDTSVACRLLTRK